MTQHLLKRVADTLSFTFKQVNLHWRTIACELIGTELKDNSTRLVFVFNT